MLSFEVELLGVFTSWHLHSTSTERIQQMIMVNRNSGLNLNSKSTLFSPKKQNKTQKPYHETEIQPHLILSFHFSAEFHKKGALTFLFVHQNWWWFSWDFALLLNRSCFFLCTRPTFHKYSSFLLLFYRCFYICCLCFP